MLTNIDSHQSPWDKGSSSQFGPKVHMPDQSLLDYSTKQFYKCWRRVSYPHPILPYSKYNVQIIWMMCGVQTQRWMGGWGWERTGSKAQQQMRSTKGWKVILTWQSVD